MKIIKLGDAEKLDFMEMFSELLDKPDIPIVEILAKAISIQKEKAEQLEGYFRTRMLRHINYLGNLVRDLRKQIEKRNKMKKNLNKNNEISERPLAPNPHKKCLNPPDVNKSKKKSLRRKYVDADKKVLEKLNAKWMTLREIIELVQESYDISESKIEGVIRELVDKNKVVKRRDEEAQTKRYQYRKTMANDVNYDD